MGFNYDKFKHSEDRDSLWTSYSDLFMGLSFVFLLLYVVASLRASTGGFETQAQVKELKRENSDLKNQLKIYESIKNQHLQNQASEDEKQMYEELMSRLDLLKDQTLDKNKELKDQINANIKEEQALNQYQQMIRNVINKNLVAKTQILRRNEVIGEQDVKIEKSAEEIAQLKTTVDQNEAQIARNEKQIELANRQLQDKMSKLKESYQQKEITEQNYQKMLKGLQNRAYAQINQLKQKTEAHQQQIAEANAALQQTTGQLQQTQAQLQAVANQKGQLEGELRNKEAAFKGQIASLEAGYAAKRAKDRAEFEGQLAKEKLGAAERAQREAEFRARAAAQERELGNKIAGLKGQLGNVSGQLAAAKAEIEDRKAVAREIEKGFAQAGIKAEVDGETGDVTIDFGDHYFESGKASLKPGMAEILKKAMPVYSKALLGNPKIADKISGLEIVGFASPTYQGRVVDPRSLDPADQKAAEYNLDLSYTRAKSIYSYIYDPNQLEFGQQVKLRSLTKVSGKSFFDANKVDRGLASLGAKKFCEKVNCKTSQRVMIKFSVDRKK